MKNMLAKVAVLQYNNASMQRLQAFKFELMPTGRQVHQLCSFAGACRFVFNKALAHQKAAYEADNTVKFSYVKLANLLPGWKLEFPWLKEAPSQALQQSLKNLERAYINFFAGRTRFPRFKHRGEHDSIRFPQGFKLDEANARVFVPKLGWMRYRKSRAVLGTIKNVTISLRAGRWFVSLQTEREVEAPRPVATTAVGIDMGVARFATLSDGQHIESLSSFKRHEVRLRRYQRALSRKCKGSGNWRKAKAKVQRMHARIANVRQDFLQKASTELSRKHAMVVLEDLKVANMSRSAAGTIPAPGRNVRAKSGLNKAILDQGWAEFRRQLEYKMQWAGGMALAVDPKNTSRTCPECGCVSAENRKTQAVFACVGCGFKGHADLVAATNILARGHRVLACGEDVSHASPARTRRAASTKQEPSELPQSLTA